MANSAFPDATYVERP